MTAGSSAADIPHVPYAEALLRACGVEDLALCRAPDAPAAIAWAESGAMALTGREDGPPRFAPGPLAHCAREALRALTALAPTEAARRSLDTIDAAALLGERAAIAGLARRGRVSPGGSCHLLATSDGFLALNLAREADVALLPAWLEAEPEAGESAWAHAARCLVTRTTAPLLERGRMIGLPLASTREAPASGSTWLRATRHHPAPARTAERAPSGVSRHGVLRVLDLSVLWAGPLCTHLLGLVGAEVVKLESTRRPDGARRGPRAFYDLLNAGKRSVALDLADARDVHRLRGLIDAADIVVESARPRALAQLGIDAERCVAERPGLTWIGITGHGRDVPCADWVAFGDDAAVAGGLSTRCGDANERPLFCGDAIADPLTGLHAAVAALCGHRTGGGRLFDVALARVTAHSTQYSVVTPEAPSASVAQRVVPARDAPGGWLAEVGDRAAPVAPPRARSASESAATLGADTGDVLRDWLGPR